MGELIKLDLTPEHIRTALDHLQGIDEKKAYKVIRYLAELLLTEIQDGLNGDSEGPFFKMVDKMYREAKEIKGCYFCDPEIDPNATEFNKDTRLCMFCRLKVANILQAFNIHPSVLFPEIGDRKVQKARVIK
jgi:hypothetical protein